MHISFRSQVIYKTAILNLKGNGIHQIIQLNIRDEHKTDLICSAADKNPKL